MDTTALLNAQTCISVSLNLLEISVFFKKTVTYGFACLYFALYSATFFFFSHTQLSFHSSIIEVLLFLPVLRGACSLSFCGPQ